MTNGPTVFVVDDDPDLCEAVRWLLEADGLAVETYTAAGDFLDAYTPDRPGVLVLDVRMHGMGGLDLQEHLIDQGFHIPVLILTGHGDVPMAVRSMKAGAVDFLQKPASDQVLLDRIRTAIRLDARNRQQRLRKDAIMARMANVTPREREVMDLVVAGTANKQIAHELSVSEKTIEVHRKRVMKKMQVDSAVELVRAVLSIRDGRQAR
ncbi:MAG: response regulator transcription factor [Phycisphaerae bacterium]